MCNMLMAMHMYEPKSSGGLENVNAVGCRILVVAELAWQRMLLLSTLIIELVKLVKPDDVVGTSAAALPAN